MSQSRSTVVYSTQNSVASSSGVSFIATITLSAVTPSCAGIHDNLQFGVLGSTTVGTRHAQRCGRWERRAYQQYPSPATLVCVCYHIMNIVRTCRYQSNIKKFQMKTNQQILLVNYCFFFLLNTVTLNSRLHGASIRATEHVGNIQYNTVSNNLLNL